MALIKCKECGKKISSSAETCPRCGAPDPRPSAPITGVKKTGWSTARKATVTFLGFTVALTLWAQLGTPPNPPAIQEAGYFKGSANDRIYSFTFVDGTRPGTIQAHASKNPYTSGAMTAAYYYPASAQHIPNDGLTLAQNIFSANNLLYRQTGLSKWSYAYMRDRMGRTTFVSCQSTPQDDLCRK